MARIYSFMANPNKLSRFLQEIKRRNVHRLMAVYGGTAFIIFEASTMIFPRWGLPDWTIDLVLYLLILGAIITFVLGWIYDITLEGVQKTKAISDIPKDETSSSNNGWRVASYISFAVILALIIFNIIAISNGETRLDESLAKSIAILPFENFSIDENQEANCLAITSEIIHHLFKVKAFDHVTSLTTVMNYRDTEKNIPEIARELNVNYILEGVYKRIGNELRISATLIQAGQDGHIWQNNYDRPYEEIVSLQSDIALQIADNLKVFISDEEQERIRENPTNNQNAYELVLQARYLRTTRKEFVTDKALELVLQAIELDPHYASAYAFAGEIILWKGTYLGDSEMQSIAWDALPFFEEALELNQNIAQAHYGMGLIDEWVRWDYIKAEKAYQKTIELEPNNISNYGLLSDFFVKMDQQEDAKYIIKRYFEDNNVTAYRNLITSSIASGNRNDTYKYIEAYLEEEGEWAHEWIGKEYLWLEEYDSSRFYLESALKSKHPIMLTPRFQAALALAKRNTNNLLEAQEILNSLIVKADSTSVGSPAYFTAWYYGGIGARDSAFYWLEKAFNNRSPEMPWLKIDPAFSNLKDDPRYWDLYERTGHKAYDDYLLKEKNN